MDRGIFLVRIARNAFNQWKSVLGLGLVQEELKAIGARQRVPFNHDRPIYRVISFRVKKIIFVFVCCFICAMNRIEFEGY